MTKKQVLKIIILLLFIFPLLNGCKKEKGENPVFVYMQNSELTYDNKVQRDNIFDAMRDIIALSSEDLEKMKYKDASGNEFKWDLKTLIQYHFKPKKPGMVLEDDDFYEDVKDERIKAIAAKILITY